MIRILLVALLLLFVSITYAQNEKDSIDILRDTINIRGYVFDNYNKPLSNVIVSSGDKNTKSTRGGYFELKGILNKSHLWFNSDSISSVLFNNESRFIIYQLQKPNTVLSSYNSKIKIEAKRKTVKKLVKLKERKIEIFGWPNYANPANYPGGMEQFFKHIQDNLKYPEKAIFNNIEGLVIIDFDVTKSGIIDNIKVIRDIDYGCSEAVIDIIQKSKKWHPAMLYGKPRKASFTLEVPFILID